MNVLSRWHTYPLAPGPCWGAATGARVHAAPALKAQSPLWPDRPRESRLPSAAGWEFVTSCVLATHGERCGFADRSVAFVTSEQPSHGAADVDVQPRLPAVAMIAEVAGGWPAAVDPVELGKPGLHVGR